MANMGMGLLGGFLEQTNANIAKEKDVQIKKDEAAQKHLDDVSYIENKYNDEFKLQKQVFAMKKAEQDSDQAEKANVHQLYMDGEIDYPEAVARLTKVGGDARDLKTATDIRTSIEPDYAAERYKQFQTEFQDQNLNPNLAGVALGAGTGGKGKSGTGATGTSAGGGGSGAGLFSDVNTTTNTSPPTTATVSMLQKGAFETGTSIKRLDDIETSYKPEYLQIPNRVYAAVSAAKESVGLELDPQDKQDLSKITAFRAQALDNLNRYIKDITGAQMSEKEAARLAAAMPNPGLPEGNLKEQVGDAPTEFEAKLHRVTKSLREFNARYNYALKNGIQLNPESPQVSIDDAKSGINKEANQYYTQLKQQNPNVDDAQIKAKVKEYIHSNYGI